MRKISLPLVAMLVLSGCYRRNYPRPTTTALIKIVGSHARVGTMRAKAKADQWTPKGRIKLRVYLLSAPRGKLRFEAVSPFDTPLATLTSDGQRFASIDHKQHRYYSGPAKPCNIARVLGLELEPEAVRQVLVGGVPILAHDKASLSWDRCQGHEVLTLQSSQSGRTQIVRLRRRGAGDWRIQSSVVKQKGKVLVELFFKSYRRIQGLHLPRVIQIKQPPHKSDLIIRYAKQEINVEIPEDAFRIKPPAGLPEQVLDCP